MTRFVICLLGIAVCLSGCDKAAPEGETVDGLTHVKLVLNWYPEAKHGGYYAALVHGYYEAEGLKVTIVPGGPGALVVTQVDLGQALFGVENADKLLQVRSQEAEVVAVMAPIQTSPRCILVHRKSGITKLRDLKNVTLAMNPGATWAIFLRKKLPLTNVTLAPDNGLGLFLQNDDYAVQGYVFSEPLAAKEQGADPVPLLVSELGFNPYSSVLITQSKTTREQQQLVRKMVRASIRGWRKYLRDPDAANRRIHELNPKMSLKALNFGAEQLRPLCRPAGMNDSQIGSMTSGRWIELSRQLVEIGVLDAKSGGASGAYSLKFLPAPKDDIERSRE